MRRVMAIVAGLVLLALVGSMTFASASRTRPATKLWGTRMSAQGSAAAVSKSDGGTRLVLISRNETITNIDNPPEGFSQGDQQAVSSPLYKPSGQRVGFLDVHALVTFLDEGSGDERDLVTFSATLPKGQIEATGAFAFSGGEAVSTTAGITGGTGSYDDVGGAVQVTFRQSDVKLVFDIEHLG